jgi:hypothetical protein
MKKLLGQIFSKLGTTSGSNGKRVIYGSIGIVFAPGPDQGLYVRGVAKDSPAWEENVKFNRTFSGQQHDEPDGSDGAIRVGDCLLDVQEILEESNTKARGKKFDVFAKSEKQVTDILRKMKSPLVELSFRRVMPSGDPTVVAVTLERKPRKLHDVKKDAKSALEEVHRRRATERMTEVDMRFAEIDEDGSGSVSLEELLRFLQVRPPFPRH